MIKLLIFLLLPTIVFAAPPTRQNSYTPNETILSADVSANENVIFNYLQAGVDSYADSSIFNADIAPSANIQSDKLNLTAIAQNIANTGTFSNTGNVTITGNLTVTGSATLGSLSLLPAGTILMWNSTVATIPSGWVLCDGNNSTPDLRDKFIVGAKQDDSGAAKTNLTGALTQSGGNVNHTHSVSGNTSAPTTGGDAAGSGTSGSNATHIHTISITSGNNSTVAVPYYALCFIQKT